MPTTATNPEVRRGYKYRVRPTKKIARILEKNFLATIKIFNVLLAENEKYKKENNNQNLDIRALATIAMKEIKQYPGVIPQSAYYVAARFFAGTKRAWSQGHSSVHEKRLDSTEASFAFSCAHPTIIKSAKSKKRAILKVNGIGDVEIVYHRELPADAKFHAITFSRNATGNYFVSIDFLMKTVVSKPIKIKKAIGLDFSVPHLYVSSDKDTKPDETLIRQYEKEAKDIALEHKKLSRMKKGGKNYEKQRKKIARLYERVENKRMDFIHKETSKLAKNFDFVGVETLSLDEIAKRFELYRKVHDDSWSIFIKTLQYKMIGKGKLFRAVSRYYPSSKTCHRCGFIKHDLKISDREYICPNCKLKADRDVNAAKNIRDQALRDAGFRIRYIRATKDPGPTPMGENAVPGDK